MIATVITLLFNADPPQSATPYGTTTRCVPVVAPAQKSVDEGNAEPDVGQSVSKSASTLSEQVADVNAFELPLGWSTDADDPRWFDSPAGAVGKLLGLLSTVLALTLGAPFWFHLLGRVSRLRTSGKPERPGAF